MKLLYCLLLSVSMHIAATAQDAAVDTLSFFSSALQKNTKAVVVKPASYSAKQKYPVLYLLHGYAGKYSNWVTKVPSVKDYAGRYNMIVVCPDAENSWYVDEPSSGKNQYEQFVSAELVQLIDKKYSTYSDRQHRAISGLSMGGHGALTLAIRHPAVFGAAGSMSGAVDMVSLKEKNNGKPVIPADTSEAIFNWKDHSALALADSNVIKNTAFIIDCGTGDFFIEYNRLLHKKLLDQKIPHDYIERDGAHNWVYWNTALPFQMLFFQRFFEKAGQ
ncbi:MAG: alpha/beta hydrolase family protein [Ferruginibacter sp.]